MNHWEWAFITFKPVVYNISFFQAFLTKKNKEISISYIGDWRKRNESWKIQFYDYQLLWKWILKHFNLTAILTSSSLLKFYFKINFRHLFYRISRLSSKYMYFVTNIGCRRQEGKFWPWKRIKLILFICLFQT